MGASLQYLNRAWFRCVILSEAGCALATCKFVWYVCAGCHTGRPNECVSVSCVYSP